MEEGVFADLKIDDVNILDAADQRNACTKCGRSRKYFCYTCFIAVGKLQDRVPSVKLPIKVDIIKHPGERDGKSTACHAAVLANQDVTIFTYPCIPDYNRYQAILVFPGEESVALEMLSRQQSSCVGDSQPTESCNVNLKDDLSLTQKDTDMAPSHQKVDSVTGNGENISVDSSVHKTVPNENTTDSCLISEDDRKRKAGESVDKVCTEDAEFDKADAPEEKETSECYEPAVKKTKMKPAPSFSKVVFIDSTWKQANSIFQDERLSDLRRVEIKNHKTNFWRSQDRRPDTYLSTIEAVYYFLCEYHQLYVDDEYDGQYDNLLFFFSYMCNQINFSKQKGKLK